MGILKPSMAPEGNITLVKSNYMEVWLKWSHRHPNHKDKKNKKKKQKRKGKDQSLRDFQGIFFPREEEMDIEKAEIMGIYHFHFVLCYRLNCIPQN